MIIEDEFQRFVASIRFTKHGCWLWKGPLKPNGYGRFSWSGKRGYSHRFSFQFFYGALPPKNYDVHHTCEVPQCVNPDHLQALSRRDHTLIGNSPCAQHARKRRCIRGHLLKGDNVYIRRDKRGRECRACRRMYKARVTQLLNAKREEKAA
jgi:hypothetical protein